MPHNPRIKVSKSVTAEVDDVKGRTYKLKLDDAGVVIIAPFQLTPAAIPLAELRRTLDEMEAKAR